MIVLQVNKSMFITFSVTFLLFSFIIFLLYIIYCYGYYNANQENYYLNQFNRNDFTFVFDHMDNDLSQEEFTIPINYMYDKNHLKNLYYLYYEGNTQTTLDEFIKKYYYGDRKITKEKIDFTVEGKTNFIKRRELKYKNISLENGSGQKSSLGIKKNIKIHLENNASLEIDDKQVACSSNLCIIDTVFGGLHTIKYVSNQFTYFGIINIIDDEQEIDIATLDNLIRIKEKAKDMTTSLIVDSSLQRGNFALNQCFMSYGCPSKKHSYLKLEEDNRVEFYTYITLDKAGDMYKGTYEIVGNFLILHFESHIYRVFDYDTQEATNIEANVDVEMRFKIESETKVCNDSYCFLYNV